MLLQLINGKVQGVVHESDVPLLKKVMSVTRMERAGHVIPASPLLRGIWESIRHEFKGDHEIEEWCRCWACEWVVDLSRSGGPQLGPFTDRAAAIRAEEKWVFENLI